ncbi:hypothetical protein HHJ49_00055 [Escherichia coli]|nr:hypothetical protein HHJ49_00055 [Escherichia coli]
MKSRLNQEGCFFYQPLFFVKSKAWSKPLYHVVPVSDADVHLVTEYGSKV